MRQVFLSLAVAVLFIAAASHLSRAEQSKYPPAVVSVVTARSAANPYPALTQFDVPIPAENFLSTDSFYLVGKGHQLYACQVEPSPITAGGRTFRWFRIIALVPCENQPLNFIPLETAVRPSVLVVSSQPVGDSLTLETNAVRAKLDARRFRVAEEVSLFGHTLLPKYEEGLVNRQQSVELVLTDRFRHADFTLTAQVSPGGFCLERRGPVIATALYRGEFAAPDLKPVPFEARFSLTAHSLIRISIVIQPGALDRETFAVKEVHLTIPCILAAASTLDFGGVHENSLGPEHYDGAGRLDVNLDGSYLFVDSKAVNLKGGGGISWADYNSGDAGLAFLFDCKANAFSITADYNADLIDVRLAPPDTKEKAAVAVETWLFFHPGRPGVKVLGHISEYLSSPPAVEPNTDYVKAVTRFP